jgi:hypothetical protein
MISSKKMILGFCLILPVLTGWTQGDLPAAMLKPMRGAAASFSTLTQKDTVVLICFWSINSDESISELNAISAHYDNWKETARFKFMAVSVDTGKLINRVRPTAITNGWTFSVFIDINGDLQKALSSNNLPQSFIVRKGKLVYQQSGFESGTENYLFQKVVEYSHGK